MSRIKAVIFDYGQVLSVPPSPEKMGRMASVMGIEPDLFRVLYSTSRAPYDRGDFAAPTYWRKFAENGRVPLNSRQIKELRRMDVELWSTVNPQMVGWLERLSTAGLKIALLSNMIPDMAVCVREKFRWLDRVCCQVLSCEVRSIKPDPAIFECCLKGLNVAPSEALFVDDLEINVRAARTLGITAIQFQSVPHLRDELAALSFAVLPPITDSLVGAAG